jgi:hypothetical protein
LILRGGRTAPRLLKVANAWRVLIEAERDRLRVEAEETQMIPNPFVFGDPVHETEQNVFAGRHDVVEQIEESVVGARHAPTLVLYGPRRMGKTSILNQLPRLLGPDFAPALVDCQNPACREGKAALLRYLSRVLAESLARRRVVMPSLELSALERQPFAAFDDWLNAVERSTPERMRMLLCLDEYESLQDTLAAGWGAELLDDLRHWLQHRPRLLVMFTGAHTFEQLGPLWTGHFVSSRRIRVGFLTREEVLPLLTSPIPEFNMTYARGALDAILAATSGQPFLTQAVAFELVEVLNQQRRREALPEDVEQAIIGALSKGGEYFANVWNDAGEDGRAILRAVATGETSPDWREARRRLQEQEVLNDAGKFAVPMVERWVRERALREDL